MTKLPFDPFNGPCKLGTGSTCCAFLGNHKGEWYCLKHGEFEAKIRERLKEGTFNAKGDNCDGPPFKFEQN